jgi:hypothetical protein
LGLSIGILICSSLFFSILVVSKCYCFGPSSGWCRCTLINTILTHEAYLKLFPVAVYTMMVYCYVRALDTSRLKFRHPERSSYSLLQSPSISGLSLATPGRLPKNAPRKIAVTFANMPKKGEAPSSNDSSDDGIMKPKEGNQGPLAEEQTFDKEEDNSRLSFRTTPPRSSIGGFIQRWKSEGSQHPEEHKRTL